MNHECRRIYTHFIHGRTANSTNSWFWTALNRLDLVQILNTHRHGTPWMMRHICSLSGSFWRLHKSPGHNHIHLKIRLLQPLSKFPPPIRKCPSFQPLQLRDPLQQHQLPPKLLKAGDGAAGCCVSCNLNLVVHTSDR